MSHTKVLILGAGPAGYTAAIYAARANLSPLLVSGLQPGGQLMITTDVENYPGFADPIQGPWLMEQMQAQAENVGTKIEFDTIVKVDASVRPIKAWGDSGTLYTCDALIVATGAQARWLDIPSETTFRGFGVSACATCDGFFFKGKAVAVVGGGNTAAEEALYMTNHASHVYLIHRRDTMRADKVLQDRLFKHPNITMIWNAAVDEVLGTYSPKQVYSVRLKDTQTGVLSELAVEGLFVAIGHIPNTDIFKNVLPLDKEGYIVAEPGSTKTAVPGIFAAGDVRDKVYRQAVTAAGLGCMAALDANDYLQSLT